MKLSGALRDFQDRIGHTFAKPEHLIRAVTHSSMSTPNRDDNQRLEFLGDRVLGLVMSEALLQADVTAPEGLLAPRFNALVRKETCADMAREIGLGEVLRLGRSEMISGGRRKQALLGDAMEAVIAAVYLDAGYDVARDFVLRCWSKRIEGVDEDARDPKTALQEWAQARRMDPPKYIETARSGPDHAPVFTIAARLDSGAEAIATAGSKRQAEQAAAKALLSVLEKST
jgi:ribonuclease-3